VKSQVPLAVHALVPLTGAAAHGAQLLELEQPVWTVLPAQVPLHRCCPVGQPMPVPVLALDEALALLLAALLLAALLLLLLAVVLLAEVELVASLLDELPVLLAEGAPPGPLVVAPGPSATPPPNPPAPSLFGSPSAALAHPCAALPIANATITKPKPIVFTRASRAGLSPISGIIAIVHAPLRRESSGGARPASGLLWRSLRRRRARTGGHAGPSGITSGTMSYRTIALASCLFTAACGSAPSAAPRAPAASTSLRDPSKPPADDVPTVGARASTETMPAPSAVPMVSPPPPPMLGAPPGGGDAYKRGVNQAAVAAPEPLAGKLTQDDIRRILDKNGDVFGDCYAIGAGGKLKDFKGVVTVKATIGPSGVVNQSDVTKSTTKNLKVDACVREAFKKIKFPRPHDGGTSVITFPITFNGVEQVQ
jgi:TonB family protein